MNNIFAGSTAYDIKHNDFPESYIDKIKTISHVVDVNPCLQIFTYFEKSTKVISIFGIIPDKLHEVFDITRIDGLDTDGLFKGKTTALVGYQLMEEYNWKIGDKIILKSGAYQEEIPFTIKGVVHGLSNAPSIIYLNLRYLQNILNNQGRVSFIYIKADDQSFIPEIIRKVEAMFHNHPVEVFAFTQKSFNDSIVDKIKAILIAFWFIGWITIISTFLLVANCIAISVRERTTEIGVMRVLGFSRSRILVLVLTESVGVALAGGMAGALLAYILPTIYHITIPATVPLHVGPDASLVVYGFLISILIGFFGGILPALNSVLMKPSESIGGVG